jgi:DNA polymerase I-like protein with 3'-5' exonuclease and polymerase domains
LKPYQTVTGRNAPSASEFVFGPARWIRGFIKPAEGRGLAYLDWASQEIAIAAALSKDQRLIDTYATGDPYLSFAIMNGLAPAQATKASHKSIRDRCKTLFLAINYGAGAWQVAQKAGITLIEAKELMFLHRESYRAFWAWLEDVVDRALLGGRMRSVFGWQRRGSFNATVPELMNWPMQTAGAEMMRAAAIASTEAGIAVNCAVHDAFLISAPLERLDKDVALMSAIMAAAGRAVTGGLDVRVEGVVVRWPDRYMDDRGEQMWRRVMGLLERRWAGATDVVRMRS